MWEVEETKAVSVKSNCKRILTCMLGKASDDFTIVLA